MTEYTSCTRCGSTVTRRVRYSSWTGVVGPLLFKQFTCGQCGALFRIKGPKLRRILSWSVCLLSAAILVAVTYIALMGPGMKVIGGQEIPPRLLARMNELVSLGSDEKIQFFYSDALVDIADGFYVLTDQRVILYSNTQELSLFGSRLLVPFSAIDAVEAHFSDNPAEDTVIEVVLADGPIYYFPASTEDAGDRKMFSYLYRSVEIAQGR